MSEPRGRPFEPGNTQGRGRPKGSRNKAQSPAQELVEQYEIHVAKKCIQMASQGDVRAIKILMDRSFPPRRDACIRMSLPPIRTVQDVAKAAGKVTRSIGRGVITPSEGEKMMNTLEAQTRIIAKSDWEARVDELEHDKAARDMPLAA
jgi:hypothetical protein